MNDTSRWEQFVARQPFSLFVQSSQYGDFYQSMGDTAWTISVFAGETLVAGVLAVGVRARRGKFLYVPYGPVIDVSHKEQSEEILLKLFTWMREFARKEHFHFIRVSPFVDDTPEWRGIYRRLGFRFAPMHILAENTWLLNLLQAEDTLLSVMNKNHRNLIRRCERDGVVIRMSTDPKDLKGLDRMLTTTAGRHKFVRFSQNYIEKEFLAFAKHGQAVLFEAYLPDGTLDGAAIIMFYGTMAAYRHSASLGQNKQLPTSYALQWAVIQEAKRRGMHWYNFWGVAPIDAVKGHPFFGISHFKKGFGGEQKDLLHCQDLPVRPWYWINWCIESLRRWKRGF